MPTPGSNILKQALTAIASSKVDYYEFIDRTTNGAGLREATFAEPVVVKGSLQAVPRSMYEALGLEFTKSYVMFYATHLIKDVTRDRTGDQIIFQGVTYQVESANDWHAIDGWNGVLCVRVAP